MSEHDQTTPPSDDDRSSEQPSHETVDSDGVGIRQEAETRTHEPASLAIGGQIGPYRVLEELGEGGMGSVYLAEQREPVRRRVALKIIKAGMDTGQVIARFEAERQALAMMDHANIAKVFDAGTTDSGRPYFVMELVEGQPITKFCDNHKLGVNARLEIFRQVCSAVQHAHQKGIIHRDLKPSNVLVTIKDNQPAPKVIDFGLAKATGQQLTEKTMFTAQGQVLGTLEYMSPEQANLNDLDVDTRSDIYSLGVILYELLTGSTPLTRESLKRAAFVEILKRIKEEEPERPSSRISQSSDSADSISSVRQIEPRKLSSLMKGELDWVVMKAIEKDRSRRYENITELASDVSHYLANEPVAARPPSLTYRVRKSYDRHRSAYWLVALAFAVVVGAALAFQAYSARTEHQHTVKNTSVAIDSLQSTSGAAVAFALDNLGELPRALVLIELQNRFPLSIGQEKLNLAYGLAHFDQVDVDVIIASLIDNETEPEEVDNIVRALRADKTESLQKILTAAEVASKDQNWVAKSRLAMVSLHLGDTSLAADMLRDQPEIVGQSFDPVQRTVFIREVADWSGSVEPVAPLLASTDNPALRSGICIALGGIRKPEQSEKSAWKPILVDWYADAMESGTHSAAGWALSQWNLEQPEIASSKIAPNDRNWWLEPNGLLFVKISAGDVVGKYGPIVVDHDYWLSDCEVTVGLFTQFMADKEYHKRNPELEPDWDGSRVFDGNDTPDLPVQEVSLYDAVMFCNWLSWKLELAPCYEIKKSKPPDSDANDAPQQDQKSGLPKRQEPYTVDWRPDANGIRLPTGPEWEFACRASTTTRFSFGDDESDLVNYGWFTVNSNSRTHKVRGKPCNAWGLFDMHGNVIEWCWGPDASWVVYSGNWQDTARYLRSSNVNRLYPVLRSYFLGFRVVKGPSSQSNKSESDK